MKSADFYEELQVQLDVLWQRFCEAKNEAYAEEQNGTVTKPEVGYIFNFETSTHDIFYFNFLKQHAIYTVQNGTPVNLHLGLSYSSANSIDITWVPADVESTLGFDRVLKQEIFLPL